MKQLETATGQNTSGTASRPGTNTGWTITRVITEAPALPAIIPAALADQMRGVAQSTGERQRARGKYDLPLVPSGTRRNLWRVRLIDVLVEILGPDTALQALGLSSGSSDLDVMMSTAPSKIDYREAA